MGCELHAPLGVKGDDVMMSQAHSFIADHVGSLVAGAASVVGPLAVVAAQAPIEQKGIDPEIMAFVVAIGPPLTWFLFKVFRSISAYYATKNARLREHAELYLADDDSGNNEKAHALLEEATRAESLAAAFGEASKKGGE